MNQTTLYGTPVSLYTGRARSYLIKAGIEYREITHSSAHYRDEVLPKAGGRRGIPTIELGDGTVIRDGAAIIDHFEATSGHSFSPKSPKQRILSRLFDVIGSDGLLRPAMHYRWSFPEENREFVMFHFESIMPAGPERSQQAATAADLAKAAGGAFGVVPETMELIETLYLELLGKLDSHFGQHPYLLGGRPCIGDFGMIAPLYAHLGRDPKPLSIMQANAIRVFRWVERMNRPEPDAGEFETQSDAYLSDDQVADSLIDLLKQIAIDFMPETRAAADCINQWIEDQQELAPGTPTPIPRGVGMGSFTVRGVTINALAQPYRFFLLKRVQDEFALLDDASQQEVQALLAACDMSDALNIRLTREVGLSNNLEVWL
jgi:glutathione S-transferase